MVTEKILKGKQIILRQIELDDCTNVYVEWLNDPNINRYLPSSHFFLGNICQTFS